MLVKANTSTITEWLALRLCMGHSAALSQLVSRTRKDPKIQKILRKHGKTFKSKDGTCPLLVSRDLSKSSVNPCILTPFSEFFLRLHGLWEGIVTLPRPPPPPFDIETMEPIEPPWQAIKEWIPDDEPDLDWFNRPRNPSNPDPDGYDQTPTSKAPEIQLDDDRILVLEYT